MRQAGTTQSKPTLAQRVPLLGVLAALALILGYLEGLLPGIPGAPGLKLGLSNVVVMFAASALGFGETLCIVSVKALFALLTGGPVAGALSLGGGISSAAVLFVLFRATRRFGLVGISVSGAVTHNLAQLLLVSLLTGSPLMTAYAPVLLLGGLVMGFATASLLRCLLPALGKWSGFAALLPQRQE